MAGNNGRGYLEKLYLESIGVHLLPVQEPAQAPVVGDDVPSTTDPSPGAGKAGLES